MPPKKRQMKHALIWWIKTGHKDIIPLSAIKKSDRKIDASIKLSWKDVKSGETTKHEAKILAIDVRDVLENIVVSNKGKIMPKPTNKIVPENILKEIVDLQQQNKIQNNIIQSNYRQTQHKMSEMIPLFPPSEQLQDENRHRIHNEMLSPSGAQPTHTITSSMINNPSAFNNYKSQAITSSNSISNQYINSAVKSHLSSGHLSSTPNSFSQTSTQDIQESAYNSGNLQATSLPNQPTYVTTRAVIHAAPQSQFDKIQETTSISSTQKYSLNQSSAVPVSRKQLEYCQPRPQTSLPDQIIYAPMTNSMETFSEPQCLPQTSSFNDNDSNRNSFLHAVDTEQSIHHHYNSNMPVSTSHQTQLNTKNMSHVLTTTEYNNKQRSDNIESSNLAEGNSNLAVTSISNDSDSDDDDSNDNSDIDGTSSSSCDLEGKNTSEIVKKMAAALPMKIKKEHIQLGEFFIGAMKYSYNLRKMGSYTSEVTYKMPTQHYTGGEDMQEISPGCHFYLNKSIISIIEETAKLPEEEITKDGKTIAKYKWENIVKDTLLEVYGNSLRNYSATAKRSAFPAIDRYLFKGLYEWANKAAGKVIPKKTFVKYINKCTSNKRKYQAKKQKTNSRKKINDRTNQTANLARHQSNVVDNPTEIAHFSRSLSAEDPNIGDVVLRSL